MKDRRDPRKWSNKEIESDSEGYKAAQSAYAEDRTEAERTRQEADDLERFEAAFVEAGGKKSDAVAAFRQHRPLFSSSLSDARGSRLRACAQHSRTTLSAVAKSQCFSG